MYLVFSLAGLALAAGMLTFFVLWRRARKARDKEAMQAAAFEATAKDFEAQLADMTQERDRWKHAAEAARSNAMIEVRNLFAYNGTEAGQEELHDA